MCIADAGFFQVLAIGPESGRLFNKDDEEIGAAPVAIVSDSFWKSHFGSSTDLSTAKLFAAGRWIQVIGVLPAKVDFPARAQVYLPHPADKRLRFGYAQKNWSADDISHGNDWVIARLRPGFTVAQASAMLKGVNAHLHEMNKDTNLALGRVGARRLQDTMTIYVKGQVTTIIVAGCFVALAALFSLLFLSSARAAELRKDIAIRVALGAGIAKLARREVLWWLRIGLLSSAATVALTMLVLRGARQLEGLAIPRLGDLHLNVTQTLWIIAATMVVAVLLSLPYLIACGRAEPVTPILNRGEVMSRLTVRPSLGRIVSIAQLSFALALTALAVRVCVNYWRLATTAPGINPSRVFVSETIPVSALNLGNLAPLPNEPASSSADSNTGSASDGAGAAERNTTSQKIEPGKIIPPNANQKMNAATSGSMQTQGLFESVERQESKQEVAARAYIASQEIIEAGEETSRQPGVISVALIAPVPYEPTAGGGQFIQVNGKYSDEAFPLYLVRGDVPKTLGLRILRGRWFDSDDERNGTNVIVVGNSLSQQYFSGKAIGKTMVVEGLAESSPRTIIGVVDDVVSNYGFEKGPTMYVPMDPLSERGSVVAKMSPGTTRAPFPIRKVPGSLLEFQPWTSMTKMMSDGGATDRASAMVAAWFACLTLLLAAAGAYAVFWMMTIQRQREMAIRICFGAFPSRVAGRMMLNAVALAACAGVGGFLIEYALERALSSRIYQFPAFSWTVFLVSFGVIVFATLLSVARPAMSILQISPAELLRDN